MDFSQFYSGEYLWVLQILFRNFGGTIALITGIYERLVHSISTINFTFIKNHYLKRRFKGFLKKDYSMKLTLNFHTVIMQYWTFNVDIS